MQFSIFNAIKNSPLLFLRSNSLLCLRILFRQIVLQAKPIADMFNCTEEQRTALLEKPFDVQRHLLKCVECRDSLAAEIADLWILIFAFSQFRIVSSSWHPQVPPAGNGANDSKALLGREVFFACATYPVPLQQW